MHLSIAVSALFLLSTIAFTSAGAQSLPVQPALAYSPSATEDALPDLSLPTGLHAAVSRPATFDRSIRPFSRIGVAFTGGTSGLGLQVATPLNDHLNLRANASYFSYYLNVVSDGIDANGRAIARWVNTSLDIYPFHSGFRISPGVTLDNGNFLHGTIYIPPGQSFDLGDGSYTSGAGDPVNGVASVNFGRHVAPSLTVGWGNLIQHNPHHLSIPVEVGFEYIGDPLVNFTLQGIACDQNNDCGDLGSDPDSLANEQQQRQKINNEIQPLRFFPILSVGFGWTF
jgi:hypothetical protein